jgi:hypothetical protein
MLKGCAAVGSRAPEGPERPPVGLFDYLYVARYVHRTAEGGGGGDGR